MANDRVNEVPQGVGDLHAELAQVDARKRSVYSIAAVAAAAVVALSWAVREPDDAFIATVYPAFGGFLVAFAVLINVRRLSIRVHAFLVLLLVLAAGVGTLRSHLQRALARAEVFAELARTDPLTGVSNRRATTEALEREVSAARRYRHDLSVVAVDVDHFKAINDTYGHQRGDQVLAHVAEVLSGELRDSDLLGRWGGEEFLIVAPHTSPEQAASLAERCRAALVAQAQMDVEVTATFGVATHRPGEDVDALLVRADDLLYAAKGAGRDRVLDDRTV